MNANPRPRKNMNVRTDEDHFTLTYKYNTKPSFQFIRLGNEQEPIPGELRCDKSILVRQDDYEMAMSNDPNSTDPKPADFYLDTNGCIDPENSSGWNELYYSHCTNSDT